MAVEVLTWGVEPSDVANITGASASTSDILAGDSIVTLFTGGRTPAASGAMSPRDIRHIQVAVCWQARWLAGNPNWQARNEFQTLTQDGLSVQSSAQWSKVLAPLAARSLRNLSWLGPRAELPTPMGTPSGLGPAFFLTDEGDYFGTDWRPLDIT